VVILKGQDGIERVYSHHGASDPLSNLNHNGHALDVVDVIAALDHGGDIKRAVAALAPLVDAEGQRERQRAHKAAESAVEAAQVIAETRPAVDIFANLSLPPFPVDYLPSSIARFARDQAQLIGLDPAVIGMSALAICAAAIDDRIRIQPKRFDPTWTESARLWIAISGDPSAKKSPGINKAAGPLRAIDHRWREDSDAKLAAWEKACAKAKKDGDDEPPKPKLKRLIVTDATIEKLADLGAQCDPRGMLSLHDELSGWLASMDAYKASGSTKDRAAWLEAYNGGPRAIDRVRAGSTFVENWSFTVLGGIQPSVIHQYAKATNHDGMLQRFLIVEAGPAGMGQDRTPDMRAKETYRELVEALTKLQPAKGAVKLSDAAHAVREDLDAKLHSVVRSHPNKFLSAALGKWNGTYARLLLTFHCIECVSNGADPIAEQVPEGTAKRASNLLWGTLLQHAVRFYGGIDAAEDAARDIAALILARSWERFTVKRDLNRYMAASRRMKPWELDETLDRLEAFGWIFPEPRRVNERGRPSAYLVAPEVHSRFSARAEQERQRRAEVVELIRELTS
jgi:hypothetical protein